MVEELAVQKPMFFFCMVFVMVGIEILLLSKYFSVEHFPSYETK